MANIVINCVKLSRQSKIDFNNVQPIILCHSGVGNRQLTQFDKTIN
ncbi:hypothetical protein XNW1_3010004 [Xenorhabdus nematophila str. Websteri]|nr:hypothetical protein XNW1_3010004 [Xenorhabdus nematophila str. Websteri]